MCMYGYTQYLMYRWMNLVYEVRIPHLCRILPTFQSIMAFINVLGLSSGTENLEQELLFTVDR